MFRNAIRTYETPCHPRIVRYDAGMKRKPNTANASRTEIKAAMAVPDHMLDTSEEPEMTLDEFWARAVPFAEMMDSRKISITLRVDEALLAIFKKDGPGYQKRIRQAMRMYAATKLAR